ncbi:MAG: PAS domain-containing protein, partial [Bacteroidales bacterium]|nr:PAS domain-containing protein [Bacteroidales bacterium]
MENNLKNELYELLKNDEPAFNFIHEGSYDGIRYWDLENPKNEWIDQRLLEILGYKPKELSHKANKRSDAVFWDEFNKDFNNFRNYLKKTGKPFKLNISHRHKNGTTVWFLCRGIVLPNIEHSKLRLLVTYKNITAEKKLDEINASTEKRFKTLIENLPDGVAICNSKGKMIHANPNSFVNFGYRNEDVIGQPGSDFT